MRNPISIRRYRYAVIVAAGAILLLLSLGVETYIREENSSSFIKNVDTLISIFHELGFAFIIAAIVSYTIEQSSRDEFNAAIDKRVTEIQENVFRATFKRNIPSDFIDEIYNLIFRSAFTRSDSEWSCILKVVAASALNDKITTSEKIMIMDTTVEYKIINISGSPADFNLNLEMERAHTQLLDDFVKVVQVTVGGNSLSGADLAKSMSESPDFKNFRYVVRNIEPNAPKNIVLRFHMIKKLTDREHALAITPSDGMKLTVEFPIEVTRHGVDSVHRTELQTVLKDDENRKYIYRLDGAILPYQGILFWWRTE